MIKQIIVFLMIFLIGTNSNLISYAETQNIEKVNNTIVQNNLNENNIQVSNDWIASIFIPGLGQMLMGEIGKGLLFLTVNTLSLFATTIISLLIRGGGADNFIFGGIVFLCLHIWNIVDARNLAFSKSQINKSINNNINIINYSFNF